MMLGIGKEAVIFVYAGLSGIVTFSCYQILLLLRELVPHSAAAVSTEDFFLLDRYQRLSVPADVSYNLWECQMVLHTRTCGWEFSGLFL